MRQKPSVVLSKPCGNFLVCIISVADIMRGFQSTFIL